MFINLRTTFIKEKKIYKFIKLMLDCCNIEGQ